VSTKALLIGCGNIGAHYDLDDPNKVWTHAKAYSLIDGLQLTVFDSAADKSKEIAAKYNAEMTEELNEEDYKKFDLISISTPTPTHFSYLKKILPQSSSVIICEKPVISFSTNVDELMNVYKSSDSKVLVNYMRRFQPGFQQLKEKLKSEFARDHVRTFIVKYSRGFLNNASHAVDLLEYLYDEPFDFLNFHIQKMELDSFDYDPTLTGSCLYLDQPVSFIGVTDVNYSIFEIEIFYADSKIVICHSGNEIRYYYNKGKSLQEIESERQTNILDKYMIPVISEALDLFHKRKSEDNFISSLIMNNKMMNIIEPLKRTNARVSN
jgi:hypothetical protein